MQITMLSVWEPKVYINQQIHSEKKDRQNNQSLYPKDNAHIITPPPLKLGTNILVFCINFHYNTLVIKIAFQYSHDFIFFNLTASIIL